MDRVPGYEPVGRGFESPQARHIVYNPSVSPIIFGGRSDFRFDGECVLCFNARCDIIALQSLLCIDAKERFTLTKKGHSHAEYTLQ